MSKRKSTKDEYEEIVPTSDRKVILSRKGFDSNAGGVASPIFFEDTSDLSGTLLSLPIPDSDARDSYAELEYDGMGYDQILSSLKAKGKTPKCHVDPDIREGERRERPQGWKPAFGQTGKAQKQLYNAGVTKGDLFLFFGWFRGAARTRDGTLRYMSKGRDFRSSNLDDWYRYSDLQVVWGYMEIGSILTDPREIRQYYWHPHAQPGKLDNSNNTLYIPTQRLSFAPELPGYGTLDFSKDRVLTKKGMTRSRWIPHPFLMPEHVGGNRKNGSRPKAGQGAGDALVYGGQWQELVCYESDGLLEWARLLICGQQ